MKITFKTFEPLTWAFFVANTIYALGFVLNGHLPFQTKSSLYDALNSVYNYLPEVWGFAGLTAVLFSLAAFRLDWKPLGVVGCFLGLATWAYATIIYLETEYYIVAGSIAGLYLSFWLWFYFTYISKVTRRT